MTDKQRIAALRRRVNKARKWPTNTCGASRHVEMLADDLVRHGKSFSLEAEPLFCAESMLAVVACLWELRTELRD